RNAVQVLRLRGPLEPALQTARDMIDRQVSHMARLVDDLLDVSRISRGKINLRCDPVELATVVASAVEGSRPLIDARRHDLQVDLPAEPVRVKGDLTRLAQVVLNLLNNSAKYTPEGGHIRLAVGTEDNRAVLRVRDDGVGIAPELLPKVFDLFTQAERTLDRSQGGLGIGLTLVKKLTEMHGGTVEAHSAGPGRGSEFVLRLPLLSQEADAAKRNGQGGAVARGRSAARRILVVDDNKDAADSLAMLLGVLGNDVRTAGDGWRAVEVAGEYRPDLVFLDIGLPGMDGYAVARRLRALPALGGAVLVAVTGYGSLGDRQRSEEAGFYGHMVKPVEFAALEELLTALPTRTT
ncbi:MAG TPA: ATP-binding protein, partial [Gemmataceae bacterium]|nr:ATP-binding protein [Gemmataceae bacterium]